MKLLNAIGIKNLTKKFGDITAVNKISFKVKTGEIFGLIGPNGAGKTTILRMISTLLNITSGTVKIFAHDIQESADKARKMISYLPEEAGAYENLTGREYLEFMAGFFSKEENTQDIVKKGIKISDLGERIDDKVGDYSKGMTRRLLVGRALMMNPKLAILDEPTSGLDVINSQEVREIIKQNSTKDTTFLISSHNMFEVEFLCERIAMMSKGKIVETGKPQNLKKKYKAENLEEVFSRVIK